MHGQFVLCPTARRPTGLQANQGDEPETVSGSRQLGQNVREPATRSLQPFLLALPSPQRPRKGPQRAPYHAAETRLIKGRRKAEDAITGARARVVG